MKAAVSTANCSFCCCLDVFLAVPVFGASGFDGSRLPVEVSNASRFSEAD